MSEKLKCPVCGEPPAEFEDPEDGEGPEIACDGFDENGTRHYITMWSEKDDLDEIRAKWLAAFGGARLEKEEGK